jgi:hypothetical protein
MAGTADGWMASAYNTTPERFAAARERINGHLAAAGRDAAAFPDLLERYAAAGARRILLWPVHDPIDQLERFAELMAPHVP